MWGIINMKHVYTIFYFRGYSFWKYRGVIANKELQRWIDALGDDSFAKSFDRYMGDRIDENNLPVNTQSMRMIELATKPLDNSVDKTVE